MCENELSLSRAVKRHFFGCVWERDALNKLEYTGKLYFLLIKSRCRCYRWHINRSSHFTQAASVKSPRISTQNLLTLCAHFLFLARLPTYVLTLPFLFVRAQSIEWQPLSSVQSSAAFSRAYSWIIANLSAFGICKHTIRIALWRLMYHKRFFKRKNGVVM
jgi:hypothetical protein